MKRGDRQFQSGNQLAHCGLVADLVGPVCRGDERVICACLSESRAASRGHGSSDGGGQSARINPFIGRIFAFADHYDNNFDIKTPCAISASSK